MISDLNLINIIENRKWAIPSNIHTSNNYKPTINITSKSSHASTHLKSIADQTTLIRIRKLGVVS
jgi:hypothetical protein